MNELDIGVKVVSISYDDDAGLEVDYAGMNAYEAWSYLFHGLELVEDQLRGDEDE